MRKKQGGKRVPGLRDVSSIALGKPTRRGKARQGIRRGKKERRRPPSHKGEPQREDQSREKECQVNRAPTSRCSFYTKSHGKERQTTTDYMAKGEGREKSQACTSSRFRGVAILARPFLEKVNRPVSCSFAFSPTA